MKYGLLLASLVAVGAWASSQNDFEWQTDLAAAIDSAAKDGKPMLVVFR
jgi:hypothetical protein